MPRTAAAWFPFYIYYSMFGFQRIGDLMWLAGDIRAKGFLLGATSGRTTLNGEGLQHQDGHSLILSSTIPTLLTYDPAFTYEVAVIVADGLRRMYVEGEDIFYYLTLYNENYEMPPMPEGVEEGILKGLYKFKAGPEQESAQGASLRQRADHPRSPRARSKSWRSNLTCQPMSGAPPVTSSCATTRCAPSAGTCFTPLTRRRSPTSRRFWRAEQGVFVAVSDNLKIVPDQIAPWVPGGLTTLGTDGFGRSDTRERLRRFFEVDAESTVIATLHALANKGQLDKSVIAKAIKDLGLDPEKAYPELV